MIIGLCGLIGSGKNTTAEYLLAQGFRQESFAASLKDAVSAVFGWPRDLLEGDTVESRQWRDTVDTWWATRLNIPKLTPRWVLQQWGTDVLRHAFHDAIWIASCENRLRNTTENVVITDLRFPNEFAAMRRLGATTISVWRGELPEWYKYALELNVAQVAEDIDRLTQKLAEYNIHSSEWAWAGQAVDYTINNTGDINELHVRVQQVLDKISSTHT